MREFLKGATQRFSEAARETLLGPRKEEAFLVPQHIKERIQELGRQIVATSNEILVDQDIARLQDSKGNVLELKRRSEITEGKYLPDTDLVISTTEVTHVGKNHYEWDVEFIFYKKGVAFSGFAKNRKGYQPETFIGGPGVKRLSSLLKTLKGIQAADKNKKI